MIVAPFHRAAPVQISQGAGQADGNNVGFGQVGRVGLERGQRAVDLAALMIEPAFRLGTRIAEPILVDHQQSRFGDAVGQPRPGQRDVTLWALTRHQRIAAGALGEELDDDAAVVDRGAIRQQKARPLAEWGLLPQRSSVTRWPMPSTSIAMRTLRPNGDVAVERSTKLGSFGDIAYLARGGVTSRSGRRRP